MYVRIAPLKRLPKNFSICDYLVPDELGDKIQIGQMVTIPFRKSKIFGLVLSLEENSTYAGKVKPLENIVNEIPFLRESEVHFFRHVALTYNMTLGTMIEMALPPLQKRKLPLVSLLLSPALKKSTPKKPKFIQYLDESEHQKILQNFDQKQTLILVSEIQAIANVVSTFAEKINVGTWHSEMSPKQKFVMWTKIRNGEIDVVVGTRSAIFLPFFDLKYIVIESEEEKDHKHEEAAPRFHVKDIALGVAELHGAQVILTSTHPSSETYYNLYQHEYEIPGIHIESNKTLGIIHVPPKDAPIFIDQKNEILGHKTDYFLSTRVQEEIAECESDVFLFLNRRGSATSIFCQSCGYKDSCPTCHNARVYHDADRMLHCHYCKIREAVPLQCPKCRANILQLRGYGTEQLEKTLNNLNTNKHIQIIRLDSDVPEKLRPELLHKPGQKIIIGTELSFQYLDWSRIGLLVCVNLDGMLTVPEYNGEERLWHLVQQMQYTRTAASKFYIQTKSPDHAFWKTLSDPDLFYRNDLKRRKAFGYPPYSYLVKYLYGGTSSAEALAKTGTVKAKIAQILTKTDKTARIYDPIELNPHFYRKKYWYGIIVLFEPNNWMEKTIAINQLLDENWKVDPRPNSILSP